MLEKGNVTEDITFDFRQRGNVRESALSQSPSEPEATFTFDKDGHIERFPLFRKLFLALIIVLTALLSFGLGRLSIAGDREPIRIEYDESISNDQFLTSNQAANALDAVGKPVASTAGEGGVVTSKNGSKYHYPHCSGAKQIKEENRLIFPSAAAAEAAGYALAANCQPK